MLKNNTNKFHRGSSSRGFTLVELLVVVAIIGILSAVVTVAVTSARAKSRDARRIADVKAIQSAIELFRDGNKGKAPDALNDLVTGGYIAAVSKDPLTDVAYTYVNGGATNKEKTTYYIQFETETDTALGALGKYCATSIDTTKSDTCTEK